MGRRRCLRRDAVSHRLELTDFIDTGHFRFLADDLEYHETAEHA